MDNLSDAEKQQLREAAEEVAKYYHWPTRLDAQASMVRDCAHYDKSPWMGFADPAAKLVALANPTAILSLLAELEAKEREIDRLRAKVLPPMIGNHECL